MIRVTIMIDDQILKKLRIKQARLQKKSARSISLSRVINDILRKRLQEKQKSN